MIYCKPTLRLAKDEFSILHWLKTSDMSRFNVVSGSKLLAMLSNTLISLCDIVFLPYQKQGLFDAFKEPKNDV